MGKTAAQLIAERADSGKPSMGLTTWKNAPEGKLLKSDVSVAKNYLIEREIKELERILVLLSHFEQGDDGGRLAGLSWAPTGVTNIAPIANTIVYAAANTISDPVFRNVARRQLKETFGQRRP